MTFFYDAVDTLLIPGDAEYAALYADGASKVSPAESVRHFTHRRWITVTGTHPHCGIADFEVGNPVFDNHGMLHTWAVHRLTHSWSEPIVYSDMSDLPHVNSELGNLPRLYWVATRNHGDLSAEQLVQLIFDTVGVRIPVHRLWGHQFENVGDQFDRSRLFGNWYA